MRSKAIFKIAIFFLLSGREVHAQVDETMGKNVFQIKVPRGTESVTGSAFAMQVDGKEYLITAAHMVKDFKRDGSMESVEVRKLKQDGNSFSLEWVSLKVKIFACDPPIDIAILIPESLMRTDIPPLEVSRELIYVGEEGMFLGFPLGNAVIANGAGFPFPIAFAKKLNLSAPMEKLLVFDGQNNPGFSGGPVIYRKNPPAVKAVISGFLPDLVKTAKCRQLREGESLDQAVPWRICDVSGTKTKGILEDTETVVPLNTGLIHAYRIEYAVELIKKHSIGPPIPH
jgi:hypothetical protein